MNRAARATASAIRRQRDFARRVRMEPGTLCMSEIRPFYRALRAYFMGLQ